VSVFGGWVCVGTSRGVMSGEKGRGVLGRPGFRRGGGGAIGGREVMYVDKRERDVGTALGRLWSGWVVGVSS
jgi:hypothetical protein